MTKQVKVDAQNRLARITGQVAGITRMVEEERYCVDVLTQVAALRGALDQFGLLMLSTHLEGCVYGHGADAESHTPMTHEERLEEIRLALNRFLK